MAEGGLYPWKVQKIKSLPRADYHHMTLGPPPAGMEWSQNPATREWTLRERCGTVVSTAVPHCVPASSSSSSSLVVNSGNHQYVVASVIHHDDSDESTTIPLASAEPIVVVAAAAEPPPSPQRHHIVMEQDTFQGICLKYKITATQLRQANCFSGTNLKLAPKILKIPDTVIAQVATPMEIANGLSHHTSTTTTTTLLQSVQENKIATVLSQSKGLVRKEVRAYLEMNDWDVESALNEIRYDQEFELLLQQQPKQQG